MPRWMWNFIICALLGVGFAVAFNKTQNYIFAFCTLVFVIGAIASIGTKRPD